MKLNKQKLSSLLPFAALVVVFLLFTALTGGQLATGRSLNRMMTQAYTVMLIGLGATFIYMHGGHRLLAGFGAGPFGNVRGPFVRGDGDVLDPAARHHCGGRLLRLLTGLATVKLNVPPFIASLCMQLAGRGILTTILNSRMVSVTQLRPYPPGPSGSWFWS